MTIASGKNLLLERRSVSVVLLTINRAAAHNLLDATTLTELRQTLQNLESDPEIRVIILTGAGDSAFATGCDESLRDESGQLLRALRDAGKPIIAAINGEASGFGADLALCCHLKIAVKGSRLFAPQAGSVQHEIGQMRDGAQLSAQLRQPGLTAAEAFSWGLVNQVVENQAQLISVCEELATKICRNAPLALRNVLAMVNRGLRMDEDDALLLESALFGLCFATEDMQEGTRAFLEKRLPNFTGR